MRNAPVMRVISQEGEQPHRAAFLRSARSSISAGRKHAAIKIAINITGSLLRIVRVSSFFVSSVCAAHHPARRADRERKPDDQPPMAPRMARHFDCENHEADER